MLYTVTYWARVCGRAEKFTFKNVASWADEKSPYDPYTLRVLRDVEGRAIAGPMVGEFVDFQAQPEGYQG